MNRLALLMLCVVAAGASSLMDFARAQVPQDLEEKIKTIGRVADPGATAALYAPLSAPQSYLGVRVSRDLRYGSSDKQQFDLFEPEAMGTSRRPVLIFVHGGGFVAGDKHPPDSPFYDNVMLWAVNQGMIGVNVNYRLAPQNPWPSGAEDLGIAVRWVQENIASHGGDPRRVFLLGHSAGAAHVASYVAQSRVSGPAGVGLAGAILLSGNIFDPGTADVSPSLKAYYGEDVALYGARSSLPGLLQSTLPLMVTSAEFDPVPFERQALQLQAALCQKNRCPTFVRFAGHNHFSEVYSINSADDAVGASILAFIRATP
jgi:triacylglycerol lipase